MAKIGFVQFNPKLEKVEENNAKIRKLISETEADLLVLPEMCNTGYFFKNKEHLKPFAEKIPEGKTTQDWISIAKENNVYIVGGLPEKDKGKIFNSAILVGPKGFIGKYQKMHLYDKEKEIFNEGETGFLVFNTKIGKVGILICFDHAFPESGRTLALKGAQVICCVFAMIKPTERCSTGLRALAYQNMIYTVMCNRIGKETDHLFKGESEVVGPKMEILAKANEGEEVIKFVDADLEKVKNKNYSKRNNLFKDRRVEFYE